MRVESSPVERMLRSPAVAVMETGVGRLVRSAPARSMDCPVSERGFALVVAVRSAPAPMVRVPLAALRFSDGAAIVMRPSPWPMVRSVAA